MLDLPLLTLAPLHRRGVGDLVLVYKRVTALAGHTSRVAELLESIKRLSAPDAASYHEQVASTPRTC